MAPDDLIDSAIDRAPAQPRLEFSRRGRLRAAVHPLRSAGRRSASAGAVPRIDAARTEVALGKRMRPHLALALSRIGTVSRSVRDLTISFVVILYLLKCSVSRWARYASTSAYISKTMTRAGFSKSATA
jgi:hypothetical protein